MMENEIDINLSVLLRAILNEYGQIKLPISGLSREVEDGKEYKLVINLVDDEYFEICMEEK